MASAINPPSSCPYHVKSYKECNEKRCTTEYPNGPPPFGSGIIGQIEHPLVTTVNCMCKYALYASFIEK